MSVIVSSVIRPMLLVLGSMGSIAAAPLPKPPGEGVLCLGTFIYFAEVTGQQCHAGRDAEFQAKIAAYARRFDDFIVRNSGGDWGKLAQFKRSQNLNSTDKSYFCAGDVAMSYERLKGVDAKELDKSVDELLAREGPPSWGDCV